MKMSVFKSSFGIAIVVLAAVAMLGSACGPSKPPSSPPAPSGNQPPVISSLKAAQMSVYLSGSTEIQCAASDPNGDLLSFKWACSGGSFSGAGPSVVWSAPPKYGSYDVTVTVEDGKGGSAQASLAINVVANQPPQISSLVANPSGILYGGSTTITCIATDPDGDAVRYSWSSSEGTITGVGNKVTWITPNKGGNFSITVLVSDGKGGETRGNVIVTVSTTEKTVTLNPIAEETGTVSSEGDRDNSMTKAGDDAKDIGYHAFWSFDVSSLIRAEVKSAKLKFANTTVRGDPFPSTTGLSGLWIWQAKYGDKLPSFQYTGTKLDRQSLLMEQPAEIDVTPEVVGSTNRFQVEAAFTKPTNGNHAAEWIEWSGATLTVTYSEKP